MKFVVYLTSYRGNKLPQFYIGSTSLHKIHTGYNGSVSSKQYKEIFRKERIQNKHLFSTKIIAGFDDRISAQLCEKRLQEKLNVVKSPLYMNKSIAKDFGWFGMDVSGELSPVYGKRWNLTQESKDNISRAQKKKWQESDYIKKISLERTGKWHRPKQLVDEHKKRKQEILKLYDSKPEFIKFGYVCKNGKTMSYEQAFALHYSTIYNVTPQAIRAMLK